MSDHTPTQRIDLTAGWCFKFGFMAALGAFVFSLALGVVGLIVTLLLGLIFGASLLPFLQNN